MVNQWIGDLRSIPYGFTKEWKNPTETQSGSPADCKAKAVALYDRMQIHGATNLRLSSASAPRPAVQRTPGWNGKHGTANMFWTPQLTGRHIKAGMWAGAYIPLYAFEGTRKFRAAPATLMAQN